MQKLLAYLIQNKIGAIIAMIVAQFLPIVSNFSLIFQSFYIVNRGISFSLPLILLSAVLNQFTLSIYLAEQSEVNLLLVFLSAHIILLEISAVFIFFKSFEYASLFFAITAGLVIFYFKNYVGFEEFKSLALSSFQVQLTDEMITEVMAMVFFSYSFLSFVFGILLQNTYFTDKYEFSVGKIYFAIVVLLGIVKFYGFVDGYVFQLFGYAIIVVALNKIYAIIKETVKYAGILISMLSMILMIYLELGIYLCMGFMLWDFLKTLNKEKRG